MLTRVCFIGAILVCAPGVCAAQPEPPSLVTDRPDFTESTEVVGHRTIQIESGLTLEQVHSTFHQVTAPQVLVRIGIGSRFELRFAGDGLISQSQQTPTGRERTTAHSDAEVAAKLKVLEAPRAGVDLAVIPFVSLPTASTGFGTTGYDPGFKIAAARELPRGFSLSGNFNLARVTEQGRHAWARAGSVSLGHGLGGPFAGYWEAYGTFSDGDCDCTVNTGVTLATSANTQIDVEVGRGVSGAAQDWFVGVGFVVRRLGR